LFEEENQAVVNFLVTIAGEHKVEALERFLANFETEVLSKGQRAQLVMAIFGDIVKNNSDSSVAIAFKTLQGVAKEKANNLNKKYPGNTINVLLMHGVFSRSIGLTKGLTACQDSDLVFIVDIDMLFTAEIVDNVFRFTSLGKAAYFPIVFKQFSNGLGGFWNTYGYGIMAAYKADIVRAGGFDTSIQGWGSEDVDLYNKCLKIGLTITRTTDPHLVHIYHKASYLFFNPKL
jgi:chondroitin sulfate synthase